jgi:hypothetical protein
MATPRHDTSLVGIRACVSQSMGLILIKPMAEGFTMPASAWNPIAMDNRVVFQFVMTIIHKRN